MDTPNFTPPNGGIVMPFDVTAYLNGLPAYQNTSVASDRLDPLRLVQEDGNYAMTVRAMPSPAQQTYTNAVPANSMIEDQMSVPEGSFLTMIGGVAIKSNGGFGRFRYRLYDVGSQSYLSDDFVAAANGSGYVQANLSFVDGATLGQVGSNGLYILNSPIAVTSPGQLTVQIVNLEDEETNIDMAFYFAMPVSQHVAVTPAWASSPQTERNYR